MGNHILLCTALLVGCAVSLPLLFRVKVTLLSLFPCKCSSLFQFIISQDLFSSPQCGVLGLSPHTCANPNLAELPKFHPFLLI